MKADILKGHLDLLLLAIVEGGPQHGYAVIEELRRRTEGAIDLPEGTIYPALHRLERAGLLRSSWSEVNGRRRRSYSLTTGGKKAAREKRREWTAFALTVQRVVGAPAWPTMA
ncbi:MAG: helix-turn-helix transcriptional regulator [Acidimicrobiales bacterium]